MPENGFLVATIVDEYGNQFHYKVPYHNYFPQATAYTAGSGNDIAYLFLEPTFGGMATGITQGYKNYIKGVFYAPNSPGNNISVLYQQNGQSTWSPVSSSNTVGYDNNYQIQFNDGQQVQTGQLDFGDLTNVPRLDGNYISINTHDIGTYNAGIDIQDAPANPNVQYET